MSETIYENQVLLGTFTGATTTSNVQVFTTPGTWIRPSNFTVVRFEAWGGGGAGGPGSVYNTGGGGGGGAYVEYWWDPLTSSAKFPITGPLPIIIGSGGVSDAGQVDPSIAGSGSAGGNSIIAFPTNSIVAYGGAGCPLTNPGGAGGGVISAGSAGVAGNGGGGGGGSAAIIYGGGSGYRVVGGLVGAYSIYGGGGGGGGGGTYPYNLPGGLSVFGGPGGAGGGPGVSATAGQRPGGAGGGGWTTASGNIGHRGASGGGGLVRITTY